MIKNFYITLVMFLFLFYIGGNAQAQSFDFETNVTGYGTKSLTNSVSGKTLVVTSQTANIFRGPDYGVVAIGGSESALFSDGSPPETSVSFSIQGGQTFDLVSFKIRDETFSGPSATITTSKGSATFTTPPNGSTLTVNSSGFTTPSNFNGITSFTLTSGSGFIYSIDDLVLTNIGSTPQVLTSGSFNAFFSCSGIASTQQSFTVSGTNLTSNIVVTPPNGFEVSTTSGSGYASSITLTQTGGTVATTTVYVRLSNTATGTPSGNVACTSTSAATQNVAVSGTVSTIILTAASQTNIACNGGATGAARVNAATGGTGPYTYNWTPGTPTGDGTVSVTGLTPGVWTCTVTDNMGCSTTRDFTITQPTTISTATAAQTNVSCNGGSNGSASVTPSGGAGGYTYSWSPSGGTAATANGLTAGTYTVTVTDANACTASRNFTITQPTTIDFTTTVLSGYDYNTGYSQTIIASGGTGSKTYAVTVGSLPSGFSLSTAGQITGTSTQIADSNFTVTATDANNCTATFNYVLKLNQIPVTVTASPSQTKVYGESDPVLSYTVSPSLLSGDSFTGSLTRVSGENIGTYAINQGSLSAGSKYLITYTAADFTITAKPITVSATTSQTKVYGEIDPVISYTVSPSLVGSDSFTGALTRVVGENTGTYGINQGSLSAGPNYMISYADANFTITAKPITVTATPSQTKVYGIADPSFAYTLSPNLEGSDALTGTLTRTTGENIGNYAITQGSLSAGSNYNITYVSRDFTITAKPITVMADDSQTKVYGTTNPVYSYTFLPSLVSGDSFTGTLTRTAGENIGNYAITQGNLSAGANYNITYVSRDFTITAKPITITTNASQTKVYGTTDPIYSYSVSPNLVSGDSFTGALTRTAGENVGTYTIAQGTLSAGGNYSITYISSNFTITKADQVITWNQTLGFDCNGETSIVLTAVSNSGLAVNYTSSNANIASVSNNSLIFQNYGSANVTASQPENMNYNAATAVILPIVSSQPNLIRKQFENIIFFDNSSKNFKSYSWYKNGVLVPGQTSQYFKENGALNGTYYAIATKLDETLITSCPLTLSPTIEEEYMRIVPNPVRSNTNFQLMTNISASRIQNARVEVFNLTGNLLTTVNTNQNNIELIAPSVEGIYIVKITLANGKYFTKNLLVKN